MSQACLSDFALRLKEKGVSDDVVLEVVERVRAEGADARARAARLYFKKSADSPLRDADVADFLDTFRLKMRGLCAAISGLRSDTDDSSFVDGVEILALDLMGEAEKISEAFGAETSLRRKRG